MQNRKLINKNLGFTLMEIIVVIALFGAIAGLTMATNIDSMRGYSFRNDRDKLVNSLARARNQSMNNVCVGTCTDGVSHGVHFSSDHYTIFAGNTYVAGDPNNEDIDINPMMSITGPTDVMFTTLRGKATMTPTGSWSITISDNTFRNSTITLNSEGQIKWTN